MRPWKLQQMTSEDPNFAASQDPQTWNTLKHRHWKLSKGVGVVFNLPGAPGCDKSFWFSNSNEYLNIFIKKTIRTNIQIYSIQTNIRIYLYRQNYTNMIRTNICIGKYSNIWIPWCNAIFIYRWQRKLNIYLILWKYIFP